MVRSGRTTLQTPHGTRPFHRVQSVTASAHLQDGSETRSLDKGGYYHVYMGIDRAELRMKLESCVKDWTQRMRDALDRFDEQM